MMQQNCGFNKSFSVVALDLEYMHFIGYCLYSLLIFMQIKIYQQVKQNQTFAVSTTFTICSIETEGKRNPVSVISILA